MRICNRPVVGTPLASLGDLLFDPNTPPVCGPGETVTPLPPNTVTVPLSWLLLAAGAAVVALAARKGR